MVNPELVKLAAYRVNQGRPKAAFVPSDAVAGMGGGGGGGDPSGGGGAPPAAPPQAAPPAPPPPDPSMGGGGGLSAGVDPNAGIAAAVAQGVQQGMSGAGGGAAGAAGGGMKPPKPDINMVATDGFQTKKMLFALFRHLNIEIPPDVIDGPGRDPTTGLPAASPVGGSDPTQGTDQGQQSMQAGAIQPIQPMQGAFPTPAPGGGGEKAGGIRVGEGVSGSVAGQQLVSRAAAVARMCRQRVAGAA